MQVEVAVGFYSSRNFHSPLLLRLAMRETVDSRAGVVPTPHRPFARKPEVYQFSHVPPGMCPKLPRPTADELFMLTNRYVDRISLLLSQALLPQRPRPERISRKYAII